MAAFEVVYERSCDGLPWVIETIEAGSAEEAEARWRERHPGDEYSIVTCGPAGGFAESWPYGKKKRKGLLEKLGNKARKLLGKADGDHPEEGVED